MKALERPIASPMQGSTTPAKGGQFLCLLPSDRTGDARASGAQCGFRFFGTVSRARKKEKCQDTAIICISDKVAMAGVFDGFGPGGGNVSEQLAKRLMRLADSKRGWIETALESQLILRMAINSCLNSGIFESFEDGSTAVLSFLHADGRYSCSMLGDSALYKVGRTVEMISDMDRVVVPTKEGMMEKPLEETSLTPEMYAMARNFLLRPYAVTGDYDAHNIMTVKGRLERGASLLLASDGLTKNVFFETDENGFVRRIGGCADMERIIRNGQAEGIGAGEALSYTIGRRMRDAIQDNGKMWTDGQRVRICADDDLSIITIGLHERG